MSRPLHTPAASGQPTAAIIGAGPGGLAAAMLLASSGVRVTLFEAQPVVGGRTSPVTAGPYRFDRGPTFFLMPYVLEEIFAAAGRRLQDHAELHRLDPMYRLILGREGQKPITLDTTQDIAEMARRIGAINPRDGQAFKRFINDNRRKLHAMESILRSPMRSPADLLNFDAMKCAPMLNPHLSVHGLLSKYFEDPLVRLSVCFQAKYLGMSPFECPSLFTILPFIEYEYGVWHPIGGCHALMRAMAEVAMDLGVTIRTGAPVEEILFDGVRAVGVRVHGAEHRFDKVVVNADATWAIKNLVPQSVRANAGATYDTSVIDSRRYSCSTYMLYLGVDGEIDLPHHTIYVSEQYRRNLQDISIDGRLSDEPSVYICNPSRIDPTLAPPGKSSLYVLVPTPNCTAAIDWTVDAPRLRQKTFEQMRKVFGITDIEQRIEQEVQITPDDWRSANINFGATFNLAHNLGQMLYRRPQNKLKGFEDLFLVGGGTHPGSGLPTIFLSAQISSRMICRELGLAFTGDDAAPRGIAAARRMLESPAEAQAALAAAGV